MSPHLASTLPDTGTDLSRKTYLTSIQTVEYLGLSSVGALKQRMRRKTIPCWVWTRMGPKSLRFVRASLDEWLEEEARKKKATVRDVHAPTVARTSALRACKPVTGVGR